ncbi:hypothetical protein [Pseudomonas putida]|uniref:hypothetical protein n=1 Tax=Pseudomonas putida TaxID=303 RepID=UPI001F51CD51|nr:hypothetical protein [Pseudomonas putida]MCI1037847.1 hypothetical protein [Pseudomonas putida]
MKNVIAFLRRPENLALANWVQSFSVVVGIVIALLQLSSVLRDQNYKKSVEYLKFEVEYAEGVSRALGLVYEYQTNLGVLSEKDYEDLYPRDNYVESLSSIRSYVSRLSTCGDFGVCPSEFVDKAVCRISKEMFLSQSRNISWPPEWKIKFSEPVEYEFYVDHHCGLFERLMFFYAR